MRENAKRDFISISYYAGTRNKLPRNTIQGKFEMGPQGPTVSSYLGFDYRGRRRKAGISSSECGASTFMLIDAAGAAAAAMAGSTLRSKPVAMTVIFTASFIVSS